MRRYGKFLKLIALMCLGLLVAGCASRAVESSLVDTANGEIGRLDVVTGEGIASAPGVMVRAESRNPFDALSGTLVAVDDTQLDQMRGGFEVDGGLKMSFGIERVTYINGLLVSSQTLNVAELQSATGGHVMDALARAGGMGLVQNGDGNSFSLNANLQLAGNVVQNSADNQKILTQTVISSEVNSLQLLRSMNLQSAVQEGIIGSLRR